MESIKIPFYLFYLAMAYHVTDCFMFSKAVHVSVLLFWKEPLTQFYTLSSYAK
jgi:hypothetical protein